MGWICGFDSGGMEMSSPVASVFSEKLEGKSSAECSIETLTPVSFTHTHTHTPHVVTH